jgi:hypothetical protein
MAINTSKVVVGGLAAGLVNNVLGFVVQGMMLGKRMMDEMVAVAPTLQGKGMDTMTTVCRVITGFVIGILIVWLYAAMRPRFGPGPKTAIIAGFVVWLCGFIFYMDWLYLGMMSPGLYAMVSVAMLVTCSITALAGAALYKEDAPA